MQKEYYDDMESPLISNGRTNDPNFLIHSRSTKKKCTNICGVIGKGGLILVVLAGSGLIAIKQPAYLLYLEQPFDPSENISLEYIIRAATSLGSNFICNASIFWTFDFVESCRRLRDSWKMIGGYELSPMLNNKEAKKNKLHIERDRNQLNYLVLDRKGNLKAGTITNEEFKEKCLQNLPTPSGNIEPLKPFASQILEITSEKGDTFPELPSWRKGLAYSAWLYLLLNIPACMVANGELTAESPPDWLMPDNEEDRELIFYIFFGIGIGNFFLTRIAAPGPIVEWLCLRRLVQKFANSPPKWVEFISNLVTAFSGPLLMTIGYAMYAPKLPKGFQDLSNFKLCPDKACLDMSWGWHAVYFSQSLVTPFFFWVVVNHYIAHFYDMFDQIRLYHKEKNNCAIVVRCGGWAGFILFVGYAGILGLVKSCPLPSVVGIIGFFMINTGSLAKVIRDYYHKYNMLTQGMPMPALEDSDSNVVFSVGNIQNQPRKPHQKTGFMSQLKSWCSFIYDKAIDPCLRSRSRHNESNIGVYVNTKTFV